MRDGNPGNPIVELQDVHLKLEGPAGPVNILRGINLAIGQGETVSVVGPSGSGKTSMLMVMAGLERQTSGRVVIDGTELSGLNEDALAIFRRDTVGIVFQDFHLVPTMTAMENVAIPLEFADHPNAFEEARAALDSVGLDHRMRHYPGQLSGGEQQRVALARAFVAGPKLILADEPTGNLDGKTGDTVIDLLFGLSARHGTTLMLITHNPALAERCTRDVMLEDGRITHDRAVNAP